MARRAKIIGTLIDVYGDEWDLREWIPTDHGWSLASGWPKGFPRGSGGVGGPRIILTKPLVDYLESVRYDLRPVQAARLPLKINRIKRLRLLLGHHQKKDRRSWWMDHADELGSMSHIEFAAKHGVSSSAVDLMHEVVFGAKKGRPDAWWKDPEVAELLRGKLPISFVADRLDRDCDATRKARRLLREWDKEQSS